MNALIVVSPPSVDDSASHETPLMLALTLIGAVLLYAAWRVCRARPPHHNRYNR